MLSARYDIGQRLCTRLFVEGSWCLSDPKCTMCRGWFSPGAVEACQHPHCYLPELTHSRTRMAGNSTGDDCGQDLRGQIVALCMTGTAD